MRNGIANVKKIKFSGWIVSWGFFFIHTAVVTEILESPMTECLGQGREPAFTVMNAPVCVCYFTVQTTSVFYCML